MTEQVELIVEILAKKGREAELREAVLELAGETHAESPGPVRFDLGEDPADARKFSGHEIWASQADLDRHAELVHTRRFLERARQLVEDPEQVLRVTRWAPMEPPAAAPAGFRHQYAHVRGTQLHYVRGGSNDPVVLLHGFPNTWYAWREVMTRLALDYTVIAVDLRGLGDSARPGEGYDVPSSAADIAELVNQLGFDSVFLAGQDWGGSIAFAYAAEHPTAVRKLAVLEAMPAGPWTESGGGRAAWFADFHAIPDLPELLVEGRESEYLGWFYEAFSATAGVPTPAATDEYVRTYRQPGAMTAAFELYRQAEREIAHNSRFASTPLDVPVLAIGGDQVFGSAVAENLTSGAASAVESLVLEDCGHFLTEERPDEIAAALRQFFR